MSNTKDKKSDKLGKFRVPRHGAFYKNQRLFAGDIVTVETEEDWRPWMVHISQPVEKLPSFVPPECLPENQKDRI